MASNLPLQSSNNVNVVKAEAPTSPIEKMYLNVKEEKNIVSDFEPKADLRRSIPPKEMYLDLNKKKNIDNDFESESKADLQRSIPSMVDGLTSDARKILFCSFKRNSFTKEVHQLSHYVIENSAYHYGQESVSDTITRMAQDYVGSNNINLFLPLGQFGTRYMGGKDAASARYIHTKRSPITRFLFPKNDDVLLNYLKEGRLKIEPTWYIPIIPTILVNGFEGIVTRWSSFIPNYNPRDIIANVRRLLNGESMVPMDPWYRGFEGTIEKTATTEAGSTYTTTGVYEEVDDNTIRITELPIRRWTKDYMKFLKAMNTHNGFIQDIRVYQDDIFVDLEIKLSEANMLVARQEGFLKTFELTSTIDTTDMHLFDEHGVIKKYATPEQIIEEFFNLRLQYYEKRKQKIMLIRDDDVRKEATPRSLWLEDLQALEIQLDKLDVAKAKQEREERMIRYRDCFRRPVKCQKQAPKKRVATKKPATKKASQVEISTKSAMDTDNNVVEVAKLRVRQAAKKKAPAPATKGVDEKSKAMALDDNDDVVEVAPAKRGIKPVASKVAKPPAAPRKRGPAASKKQAEEVVTLVSPEKKVRKMRSSPFNNKSGSVMAANKEKEGESTSDIVVEKQRPQRANKKQINYAE